MGKPRYLNGLTVLLFTDALLLMASQISTQQSCTFINLTRAEYWPPVMTYTFESAESFGRLFLPEYEAVAIVMWVDMRDQTAYHSSANPKYEADLLFTVKNFALETNKVTVSLNGIQTSDNVFISALPGEFDSGYIKFFDDGKIFAVQFFNVQLSHKDLKDSFTYQISLHADGRIDFVYAFVPYELSYVREVIKDYTGMFGISIGDRMAFDMSIDTYNIKNMTVISLVPHDSCSFLKTCFKCTGGNYQKDQLSPIFCAWDTKMQTCRGKKMLFENSLPHDITNPSDCLSEYIEEYTDEWRDYWRYYDFTFLALLTGFIYLLSRTRAANLAQYIRNFVDRL